MFFALLHHPLLGVHHAVPEELAATLAELLKAGGLEMPSSPDAANVDMAQVRRS